MWNNLSRIMRKLCKQINKKMLGILIFSFYDETILIISQEIKLIFLCVTVNLKKISVS